MEYTSKHRRTSKYPAEAKQILFPLEGERNQNNEQIDMQKKMID